MPTSNYRLIPNIIRVARDISPRSVLDVGIGFGKYGFLLREYLDVQSQGSGRFDASVRNVVIDGIEVFEEYVTDLQRLIYDRIYIGDAKEVIGNLGPYDMILICDVIEHFQKEDGLLFLDKVMARVRKAAVITTPAHSYPQGAVYGNPAEEHVSQWVVADFRRFGHLSSIVSNGILMVGITPAPRRLALDPKEPLVERLRRQARRCRLVRWVRGTQEAS